MSYSRVIVLIPSQNELALEEALKTVDLCCVHFLKIRGYSCNPNFYESDWSDQVSKLSWLLMTSNYPM
jgi:hypothetical protein